MIEAQSDQPKGERENMDHAWENELTEEDMPDPVQRDEAAQSLKLDPDTLAE